MQEVQTFRRLGVRPTTARTVWMLGFQRRRLRRWECEILLPKPGPLPHTSQTEATGIAPKGYMHGNGQRPTPDRARAAVREYPTSHPERELSPEGRTGRRGGNWAARRELGGPEGTGRPGGNWAAGTRTGAGRSHGPILPPLSCHHAGTGVPGRRGGASLVRGG